MNATGTIKTPKALTKLVPGLTLQQLSKDSGVPAGTLSRIFSGKRSSTIKTIKRIAKGLGKTEEEVFTALGKIKRNGKP